MCDYIDIQKLWYDNELAQLLVVCASATITASTVIYVTDDLIDELIVQIEQFINGQIPEGNWANEDKGDKSSLCVSLRFLHKDRLGHILIEVYMELDDGGNYSSHNCCFYINTEIGLLTSFCEKLPQLKLKASGTRVVLNDDGVM